MKPFSFLELEGIPIFEQLQIEEALLRGDDRNWCLINMNAPPAIVMGISARPEEMIDLEKTKKDKIPLVKRFSGGGTVYIDQNTVFITFICQTEDMPIEPYPQAIMQWTETLYTPFFPPQFRLRENDYVFGDHKCGGNAQYIRKGRWLHHTSFLWDYHPEKMEYLRMPKKKPCYRGERGHQDFLCRLKDHLSCKTTFINNLKSHLMKKLDGEKVDLSSLSLSQTHRKSTIRID